MPFDFKQLRTKLDTGNITAAVIGLGYVGLPLSYTMFSKGVRVIGLDIDSAKIAMLEKGESYLDSVAGAVIKGAVQKGLFVPSADFAKLPDADFIVICVPTPLDEQHQPDLSYVENTARTVARHLRPGQVVVLESTTYPGTMREIVVPLLERESGLKDGQDFHAAFSPEREDPGNKQFRTGIIPKIVGAGNDEALALSTAFYELFIEAVVPVSSMEVAEAAKITENVFRAINIAFVNELKVIFDRMDIDIWEVIDAAKTKPFGFMPFYPGPGIGGHCIPVDPFYLSWKAEQMGQKTRFIELAGEINLSMKDYITGKMEQALGKKDFAGLKFLIAGVAYKKNVGDQRESPAFPLMEDLLARGAKIDFHDPHVPELLPSRHFPELSGATSIALTAKALAEYDAVLIITDHDNVDYKTMAEYSRLIIDTRNALRSRGITPKAKTIRA